MIDTRNSLAAALAMAAFVPALGCASLSGQLPQASAAALGMGYNMTASARGFAAVANNPAGLGMADSPGFSLAIPAVAVEAGLGPVSLSDLADWEGRLVPEDVKRDWLERVAAAGGQGGSVFAGVTPVALSVGSFGIQASSQAAAAVDLPADAVELMLFGNAGRTGTAGDLEFAGSSIDSFVLSTIAVSWGFRASDALHLGVTGKYQGGSGLIVARDDGSLFRSDPLAVELSFPALSPEGEHFGFDDGSGVGLDVGAIWTGPSVTVGATIQNLVSTFEWDLAGFSYVPGQAVFAVGSAESDFDEQPASGAPQVLLDAAEELTLKPAFAVGVEMSPTSLVRLQADIRKRVSGGLAVGPDFHMGVGAELLALPVLPLRAHLAAVSGGVQVGGGASLVLGPMHLSGAIALRTEEGSNATIGMLTLSFGGS